MRQADNIMLEDSNIAEPHAWLDYQIASSVSRDQRQCLPSSEQMRQWVSCCCQAACHSTLVELTVRVVNADEMQALNAQYRGKDRVTNVLAFASELPESINVPLLGDIIICVEVVQKEADSQGKKPIEHWAHMVVHGTLHLLGYDHIAENDAKIMEQLEVHTLAQLGFPDPYVEIAKT